MKRTLSILLLAAMLLTSAIALSACGHKCVFATAWTTDATAHWHACEDSSCTEITDKADHTWNEGEITTAATQEADGVKTFTCTVCNHTKTEPVAYTGMTEAEWNTAFVTDLFKNFTYKEEATVTMTGMEMTSTSEYKFTETAASLGMTMMGETEVMEIPAEEVEMYREELVTSLLELTVFTNYKYDAATKTYVLEGDSNITIETLGAELTSAVLTFENGKLVKMVYVCKVTEEGMEMTVSSSITFSNYGTTVVDTPAE